MHTPQHTRPLWLGVLLASLAPPLCLLPVLFFSSTGSPSLPDMLRTGAAVFLVAFPLAVMAMLVFGLPYVLWLRSNKRLNSLFVCAGAIGAGVITFGLLTWALSGDHRAPNLLQLFCGAGFGLAAGIAFCVGVGTGHSIKPTPRRVSIQTSNLP